MARIFLSSSISLLLAVSSVGCTDDNDLKETQNETPPGDDTGMPPDTTEPDTSPDPDTAMIPDAPATASIVVTPTTGLKTTEAGGMATFTIVLSRKPTADVTIGLTSSNEKEGTLDRKSVVFTSENWDAPQTITITGVDDTAADGAQAYKIVTAAAKSTDAAYEGLDPDDVAVSNVDDDSPGVTVTPTTGLKTTEMGGEATFTIRLNAKPAADVTIPLSSSNDKEGVVAPKSVVFTTLNWNAPQTVTVTGVDDSAADGPQTYKIVTAPATSSDSTYNGIDGDDVSVINVDDESAGITVTPTTGLSVTEAGGSATFTVRLNSKPTADVTIPLTSSKTTEGTVSPASVVFTADNWNAPQTVTVTGVDDSTADGNQAFKIVTAAAKSTDAAYNGVDADDVSVTNVDDETAGFTVTPTSGLTTHETGTTATFTIRLNSKPNGTVVVPLTSSNTKEGSVSPASVTFTTDSWNAPQTVTAMGVDDAVADGNQPYAIVTGVATGTDTTGYVGMNPADVTITNIDNDSPGFTTTTPTTGTTEAGGKSTFTIKLNSQPTGTVTIPLASLDTTEGTVSPASLTFDATNWSTPQSVTVTGVDDFVADGNQTYTVQLGAVTGSDGSGYIGLNPTDVVLANTDDDSPGITVTPTSGLTTDEAGGTAKFTVQLNSQPTADVVIPLTSSNTKEGTVSPASLTFTASNWNTAQTVTVTGVDDSVADGDQVYFVRTGAATSADTGYSKFDAADVSVTNSDNDKASIVVTPTSGLVTTEAGGVATFTVVLTSAPTAAVSISLATSNAAEGTIAVKAVSFDATNWSKAQTVTVTGVDDAIDDGDVGYSIITGAATSSDSKYNGLNPPDVSLVNQDNDTDCTVSACGASCLEVLKTNPKLPSGNYPIFPKLVKKQFIVYCADMEKGAPTEYLNLNAKVNYSHFSSVGAKCFDVCKDYTVYYSKVRFDPATLSINTFDRRFATGTGGTADCYKTYGCSGYDLNYASAASCSASPGTGSVDLGTNPFSFSASPPLGAMGSPAKGDWKPSADYKSASVTGFGGCGSFGLSDLKATPVGHGSVPLEYAP